MILPSLTSTIDALEPFSGTPQKLMSRISVVSPEAPVVLMSSAIPHLPMVADAERDAMAVARDSKVFHDAD